MITKTIALLYNFSSLVNWIKANPYNSFSTILTILSICLAFYFYYKSLKVKKPLYNYSIRSIIQKNPLLRKLKFYYGDIPIENLLLTTIAFWNDGNDTLKKEDISSTLPLILKGGEGLIIYEYEIVDSNLENNFVISKINDNTLVIEFDYIDYNDGVIINIFHNNVETGLVKPYGKFIGSSPLTRWTDELTILERLDFLSRLNEYRKRTNSNIQKGLIFMLICLLTLPTICIFIVLGTINMIWNVMKKAPLKKYQLEGNYIYKV